jgi:hypothetical protein
LFPLAARKTSSSPRNHSFTSRSIIPRNVPAIKMSFTRQQSPDEESLYSGPDGKGFNPETRSRLLQQCWPIFQSDEPHTRGFTALLVVLRQIYSRVPDSLWPDYGEESLRLLQVARKVLNERNWRGTYENKRTALLDIVEDPSNSMDQLSFLSLVRNQVLVHNFWTRREYLLYSTQMYSMAPNTYIWRPRRALEAAFIADLSLFEWDGSRPLSESISDAFGIFDTETGWSHLRLPEMPTIIRVHYAPPPGNQNNYRFDHVRNVELRAFDFKPQDAEGKIKRLEETEARYELIASVKLRQTQDGTDHVRLYGADGANILPPEPARCIVDDNWYIGQPDTSFMLFFVKTTNLVPRASVAEVAIRNGAHITTDAPRDNTPAPNARGSGANAEQQPLIDPNVGQPASLSQFGSMRSNAFPKHTEPDRRPRPYPGSRRNGPRPRADTYRPVYSPRARQSLSPDRRRERRPAPPPRQQAPNHPPHQPHRAAISNGSYSDALREIEEEMQRLDEQLEILRRKLELARRRRDLEPPRQRSTSPNPRPNFPQNRRERNYVDTAIKREEEVPIYQTFDDFIRRPRR